MKETLKVEMHKYKLWLILNSNNYNNKKCCISNYSTIVTNCSRNMISCWCNSNNCNNINHNLPSHNSNTNSNHHHHHLFNHPLSQIPTNTQHSRTIPTFYWSNHHRQSQLLYSTWRDSDCWVCLLRRKKRKLEVAVNIKTCIDWRCSRRVKEKRNISKDALWRRNNKEEIEIIFKRGLKHKLKAKANYKVNWIVKSIIVNIVIKIKNMTNMKIVMKMIKIKMMMMNINNNNKMTKMSILLHLTYL